MANYLYFITSLFVFFSLETSAMSDYCDLTCDIKGIVYQHTVCQYAPCSIVGECANHKQIPFSGNDKKLIVDTHNVLRAQVANGEQSGQPSAANMRELEWDDEIASIAQCWANQCHFAHDKCRKTHEISVGQNAGMQLSTDKDDVISEGKLNDTINGWYGEVSKYNPSGLDKYEFSETTGHYTQVVWAKTSKIGCGRVIHNQDYEGTDYYAQTIICNYGEAGNVRGTPVYMTGQPASACENGKSNNYLGLCV